MPHEAGVDVNFETPMPHDDTAGYSTTSEATYFNPLRKTATGIQIHHKTTKVGTPLAVDYNVSVDWIAVGN